MDGDLHIFKEGDLFGAKDQAGKIIIPPQYIEMYDFCCGLSCVRNHKYQYAYINRYNEQIVPFGKYCWIDPYFVCGFARVKGGDKWSIIDTRGNVLSKLYDRIWPIKERYLFSAKAFKGDKEEAINLKEISNPYLLDDLTYIHAYTIDEFKKTFHCSVLRVRQEQRTKKIIFTYGCNTGQVTYKGIPQTPVISIVSNSYGNIFPLLLAKEDLGKRCLEFQKPPVTAKTIDDYLAETDTSRECHWDWEEAKLDAFEGDDSNYWNVE